MKKGLGVGENQSPEEKGFEIGKQKQLLAVNGYFEIRTSPLITESVNICNKDG